MDFDTAFERVLSYEGGYIQDPRDPGGETKFGISKRAYPMEDIKGMTLDRAKVIYRRDYWGAAGCDTLPAGLRLHVFDLAVHSGVRAAIKALQRAVGEAPDGILGPRTLLAVDSMPVQRVVARLTAERMQLITALGSFDIYGRGWVRRLAANLMEV